MRFYTPGKIELLRKNILRLSLKFPEGFLLADTENLCRICNGIGPESWKRKYRFTATFILRNYQEAAMIHDYCYTFSDGKSESRKYYDSLFYENCLLLLHYYYPNWKIWLFPLKVYAFCKICAAKRLLQIFGASAYLSAFEKRKEKENASFQ